MKQTQKQLQEGEEDDLICFDYVSQCLTEIVVQQNKNRAWTQLQQGTISYEQFELSISRSFGPLMSRRELSFLLQLLDVLWCKKSRKSLFHFSKTMSQDEQSGNDNNKKTAEHELPAAANVGDVEMKSSSIYWWRRIGRPDDQVPLWARKGDSTLVPDYQVSDRFLC